MATDLKGQEELYEENKNDFCQAGRIFKTPKGTDKALDRWMDAPETREECVKGMMVDIIRSVPSLHRIFWPTIYWLSNLQLVPFMVTNI